jgi:WD40 repeat protein
MPPVDPYELSTRLLFGPGTWFEQCRKAVGDPDATAGLIRRLAPDGDAARAFATRNTWPGESRLTGAADRPLGPAQSAALAAANVVTALTSGTDTGDVLRDAAAHWRRANVLPVLALSGADIDTGLADPRANVAARRLAVRTDEAAPPDTAAFGLLALLVRALTTGWPRRRREVQVPVLFDRRSTGGSGTLRLTLLDAGPPGLYPDPRAMLFLVADRRFAQALDVAWRTAAAPLTGRCVVWRLTTDELPVDQVAGGSLGAAFGVALTDLARRTPPPIRVRRLDRRCAITAGLEPDLRLSPVTGIPNKLEQAIRQRLRVILAPPADPETLPEPLLRDARVRFAADLPAAVRLSRTRLNPAFVAIVAALLLAVAGVSGGVLAAARESRAAHVRAVAAALLPAAASLRTADPAGALLLEALAVRLDGTGARAALIHSVLANRYVGALAGPANHSPCNGPQTWSPDGTHVITVQRDMATLRNEVLLWDTGRRAIDRTIKVSGQVTSCAFAPDGRTVALAVDERLVLVPIDRPPPSTSDIPVHWLQYAPNGLLATMAEGQGVRLWSIADPRRPRILSNVAATILQLGVSDAPLLAFSRDSRMLAFGERERVVLTDIGRPDRPRVIRSIPTTPASLALSAKDTLAIGSTGGDTELWDVRDPDRPVRTGILSAPSTVRLPVASAGFTPDGSRLITEADGSSQIWQIDGAKSRLVRALALTNRQVTSADLSPDGKTALVYDADGTSTLWHLSGLETPPETARLPLGPARITGLSVLSPANRLVVTAAGGAATVWDVGDPARPRLLHGAGPRGGRGTVENSATPSPYAETSRTAFAAEGRRYAAADGSGGIGVWTVEPDGRIRQTGAIPRIGERGIDPLALSPDGTLLAARPYGDRPAAPVSLWDVRDTPWIVGRLPATTDTPATTFAPDGHTLVTVTSTVTWWSVTDPANPSALASRGLPVAEGRPGPIVFTPDGRRMFVTNGTGPGTIWDTADPAKPKALATVRAVSGSDADLGVLRGSALILTATGAVDIWDVTDPEAASEAAVLTSGDENAVFFDHLAVTPNGLLAATHLAHGITSMYTGEALVRMRDLRAILDVLADPVTAACRIAGHDLSPEMWQQYAPGLQVRPICR